MKERDYDLNISPRHRADFGIRWRTRKTLRTVPEEFAVHKSKNARGSHRVDSRQSEYIFETATHLFQLDHVSKARVNQLTHFTTNISEMLIKRHLICTLQNYEFYLENLVINVMPILKS